MNESGLSPEPEPCEEPAESARVAAGVIPEILFEDAHLAIIRKPAGWLTVPGMPGSMSARDPSVQQLLEKLWDTASGGGGFVGTVHRLDRPVSGVMVWAKTTRAARRLSEQFAKGQVVKQYWAVVTGGPRQASGVWEDWLILQRIEGRNSVKRCLPGAPGGQPARTDWQRLDAPGLRAGLCWLGLWPRTGRMHQLRVQSAERGWPIVGDVGYGSKEPWPHPWKMALHARSLTFKHPETQETYLAESAVPEHWFSLGEVTPWVEPGEGSFRIRKT